MSSVRCLPGRRESRLHDPSSGSTSALTPEGIYPMMYFPHNLHFLSVAASMDGRSAVAERAARELDAAVPDHNVRHMPRLEMFRPALLFALVRFGRWEDVLAVPAPPSEQRYTTGT
ncbi:hypothetical protein [Sorangium sp. So ce887]|uniref:hypothetical protein n=1 Tax=Sorangium sp. So ce887 TaxID=3133324 RepID=UPI003F615AA3